MSIENPGRNRRLLSAGVLASVVALSTGEAAGCENAGAAGRFSTETQNERYAHGISRLEINIDSGNLTLSPGDANEVSVDRRLRWEHNKPIIKEQWNGDTLRISAVCPDDNNCTVDYTVRVPEAVAVQAHTDSGDLSVRDLTKNLDLKNQSGDIDVRNAAGQVRITGDSGDITGSGLRSADVEVRTKSGNVSLAFKNAPTSAKAVVDAGAIEIAVPRADGYRVQATTKDGRRDVEVRDERGGKHSIVAQLVSGNVTVRYA